MAKEEYKRWLRQAEADFDTAEYTLWGKKPNQVISFLKEFEGKKSFRRCPPFYLEWNFKQDTDILCLTPEELKIKENQIGIIRSAVKEGVLI